MDIDNLKSLALAATQGKWHWVNPENDQPRQPGEWRASLRTVEEFPSKYSVGNLPKFIIDAEIDDRNMEANAAFIAASCPATVLELIAEDERKANRIAELEAEVEQVRASLKTAALEAWNANSALTVLRAKLAAGAAAGGGTSIEGIARYEEYGNESGGGLQEAANGEFVRLEDVERLIGSDSAAGTEKDAALSPELLAVLTFLDGSAPLDGVWFGEWHPAKVGKFWWRANLRAAIAAHNKAGKCAERIVDAATEKEKR